MAICGPQAQRTRRPPAARRTSPSATTSSDRPPARGPPSSRLHHEPSRLCRMTEISIEPFTQAHLDGLIALVAAEGWTEYADDVERTRRALTAPGVTTLVALVDGQVVGAIQVQSDGL